MGPEENGCRFADDIFKCVLLNENVGISNKILLKIILEGLFDNNSALVLGVARWRAGDNPLL